MKNSDPPVLATELLERLVSGTHREALGGDLMEQYRQGRSGAWYWRQVLGAVLVGVAKDLRDHKLLVVRAGAIGLAIYFLSAFPVIWLAQWLADQGLPRTWTMKWLLWGPYIACGVSGWIVARLHPRQKLAMVSVYSASLLSFESLHLCVGLLIAGGRYPITPQMLVISTLLQIVRPLFVLLGGLLSALARGGANSSARSRTGRQLG